MNVDEMPAGKEFDLILAEKVMGWHLYQSPKGMQFTIRDNGLKPRDSYIIPWYDLNHQGIETTTKFSSNLIDAWMILEKVYEKTGHAKIRLMKWDKHKAAGWTAPYGCQFGDGQKFCCADTPALAICRSAIRAIERLEKP